MKTREERIRMLLHPERYTDEQLAQMLDETKIPCPMPKKNGNAKGPPASVR